MKVGNFNRYVMSRNKNHLKTNSDLSISQKYFFAHFKVHSDKTFYSKCFTQSKSKSMHVIPFVKYPKEKNIHYSGYKKIKIINKTMKVRKVRQLKQ